MRDSMTKAEAEEMLATLAGYFRIPTPILSWSERARNGHASWTRNTISCGQLVWRGVTNVLLHEFAHILAHARFGKHQIHGKLFMHTLWDVSNAWLGDACKYDWATEYSNVKAYGKRRTS